MVRGFNTIGLRGVRVSRLDNDGEWIVKEKFIEWSPRPETINVVEAAAAAAEDMRGYEPTLRSVYYQLVANKTIDNSQREYNRLKSILTKARNAGMINWSAFTDKGRVPDTPYVMESRQRALQGLHHHVSLDMWENQDTYVEVWVEKQAQEGVVRIACDDYRLPWLSCKGNLSATAAYDAGKRYAAAEEAGKSLVLIHLGDHDPNGIDMTRDNGERLKLYGGLENVHVDRIALNLDQVEKFNLPPDPAKDTDSRYKAYAAIYGDDVWELDAIKPQQLEPIVRAAIEKYVDFDALEEKQEEEELRRKELVWIGENPDRILKYAKKRMDKENE